MQSPLRSSTGRGGVAPWYRIPDKTAVSVEHPCIVKNVNKAISMLGSSTAIAQILEKDNEKPMGLSFHPEDPAARPLLSMNATSNNVLLKITVPKRTGRKRKRGSNDPFTYDSDHSSARKDARYLLQSLNDNANTYSLEPIATIESTHLWRTMPDFVYSTTTSPFFNNFRSSVLPLSYPALKTYKLDLTQATSATSTEVIPPPILSTASIPHNYAYRQNPAVKTITDPFTGTKTLLNTQAAMKVHTWQMHYNDHPYPTTTPPHAAPLSTLPHNFQGLIYILNSLFATRPLWTRRALLNQLPNNAPIFLTRYALAYVSFAIRSGPWRDTYCRLGVDPRSDPQYRKYQSILVQLVPSKGPRTSSLNPTNTNATNMDAEAIAYARTWARSPDRNSHIFTGTGAVPPDGKAWQLCDLQDPHLKSLVEIPELHLRAKCEERYFGWYPNGTQSKIRILLKTKVDTMMEGMTLEEMGLSEAQISRFVDLPEEWSPEHAVSRGGKVVDPTVAYLGPNVREKERAGTLNRRELIWASAYRSMCRAKEGDIPLSNGRLSKGKPMFRESYLGLGSSLEGTHTPMEDMEDGIEKALEREDVLDRFEEPEGEGELDGGGDEGNGETGVVGQYDGAMDRDIQMQVDADAGQNYDDGDDDLDHIEDR
jgi:general transcription factor 3C polypeptide 5 (transcription factor C subunit 1)